jgi:hypothetical protein
MQNLSHEEQKSFTHGDFWIPEEEREIYKIALRTLNQADIPYVVAGAYAIYEHTGIYRETKDLDIFLQPEYIIPAARVLSDAGFKTRLEQPHWLAKAKMDPFFVDLIYGMGNGLALIDPDWHTHGSTAILAATPVRVAPAEELIWHRLFISERHRHDMADILHLIQCKGHTLDWDRLVRKVDTHWPLLLAQLQTFRYVYPGMTDRIPERIMRDLLQRSLAELDTDDAATPEELRLTRGTLVSRFSFAIDVNEWGFRDLRDEMRNEMQRMPIIQEITASEVWNERARQDDAVAEEGEA